MMNFIQISLFILIVLFMFDVLLLLLVPFMYLLLLIPDPLKFCELSKYVDSFPNKAICKKKKNF